MQELIGKALSQLHYIPQTCMLCVLVMMAFLFIRDNGKESINKIMAVIKGERWIAIFLLYVSFVLTVTVFARLRTNPCRYILRFLVLGKSKKGDLMIAENTLLFIPLIYLFLQSFNYKKPFRAALCFSVSMTMFIELCQLCFWLGHFQVSDLVYNTLGGIIGYIFWYVITLLRG